MKRFCGSFVSRALLCTAVTLLVAMPAWAELHPLPRHISGANLINGEANYDDVGFMGIGIQIESSGDIPAEQKHLDATGILSLASGNYTWGETTVTGSPMEFKLSPDMKLKENLNYIPVDDSGEDRWFRGAADTGLNGVTASWTFEALPELNGSGTLQTFLSTAEQLETAVPYIKLTSDDSGNITSVYWAIVKSGDTSTPLELDYDSRVQIRVRTTDGETADVMKKKDFDTGTQMSGTIDGTIDLDSGTLKEDNVEFWEVRFTDRTVSIRPNTRRYFWRFFPVEPQDVTITKKADVTVKAGASATLSFDVSPVEAYGTMTLDVADTSIATKSDDLKFADGKVTVTITGVKEGTTKATLTFVSGSARYNAPDPVTASITVTNTTDSPVSSKDSGGGCNAGFALLGLLAVGGAALLKRR